MNKDIIFKKILYIACIVIAILVVILNAIDLLNLVSINSKITTILLDTEMIILGILSWKENKIVSIICIVLAIILIIFTLI